MSLKDMDIEAFLNMRDWFQDAITAKGGKIIDTGMGAGRADIGIEIEGYEYGVQIIPRDNTPTEPLPRREDVRGILSPYPERRPKKPVQPGQTLDEDRQ